MFCEEGVFFAQLMTTDFKKLIHIVFLKIERQLKASTNIIDFCSKKVLNKCKLT